MTLIKFKLVGRAVEVIGAKSISNGINLGRDNEVFVSQEWKAVYDTTRPAKLCCFIARTKSTRIKRAQKLRDAPASNFIFASFYEPLDVYRGKIRIRVFLGSKRIIQSSRVFDRCSQDRNVNVAAPNFMELQDSNFIVANHKVD